MNFYRLSSEFLATEDNDLFWKFVEKIGILPEQTEEQMYSIAREIARDLLSPLQNQILDYAMNMRYFSPTIEMFSQLGLLQVTDSSQTSPFGLIDGSLFQTTDALKIAIENANDQNER